MCSRAWEKVELDRKKRLWKHWCYSTAPAHPSFASWTLWGESPLLQPVLCHQSPKQQSQATSDGNLCVRQTESFPLSPLCKISTTVLESELSLLSWPLAGLWGCQKHKLDSPVPDTGEQPSIPLLSCLLIPAPFPLVTEKTFSFKFHSQCFYYVHPIPRQCLSFHHSRSFPCHPGPCSTSWIFAFSWLLIRWDFASFCAHFAHLECIRYLKPHYKERLVKYPPLPQWSLSFMLPFLTFLWTLDLEGYFFSPLSSNQRHWSPTWSHVLTKKRIQRATRTTGWILNLKQGKVGIATLP